MENQIEGNLFQELLLNEKIIVEPQFLNSKIDETLSEKLRNKIEEKCISDGFVKKDSIKILKKGLGALKGSQFNGNITYELLYNAEICNPKKGSTIQAKVKFINKLGVLASNGPLTIIVGRQFHQNTELFDKLSQDDIIDVEVIASKFSLDDREIKIIAKIKTDEEEPNEFVEGDLLDDTNIMEEEFDDELDDLEIESVDNEDINSETMNEEEEEEEDENENENENENEIENDEEVDVDEDIIDQDNEE